MTAKLQAISEEEIIVCFSQHRFPLIPHFLFYLMTYLLHLFCFLNFILTIQLTNSLYFPDLCRDRCINKLFGYNFLWTVSCFGAGNKRNSPLSGTAQAKYSYVSYHALLFTTGSSSLWIYNAAIWKSWWNGKYCWLILLLIREISSDMFLASLSQCLLEGFFLASSKLIYMFF